MAMKLYYGGFADYKEFVVADSEEQAILKVGIKINAPFLPITVEEISEVDGYQIQPTTNELFESLLESLTDAEQEPETVIPESEKLTTETTEISPTETEPFHCKKCDFIAENNGQLLAHYRKCHPKGD